MEKIMKQINLVMMKTAHNFSELSYAVRKKVGAVLSNNGRIVACGYNGTIPGADNCCEVDCQHCLGHGTVPPGSDEHLCKNCDGGGIVTSEFVLHAEQNLLTFCNREGLRTENCTLYVTMAPCKTCSKLIASAGIKEVFYDEEYRDLDGVQFLKDLGLKVEQIKGK
jgi:dCMP deaminase